MAFNDLLVHIFLHNKKVDHQYV